MATGFRSRGGASISPAYAGCLLASQRWGRLGPNPEQLLEVPLAITRLTRTGQGRGTAALPIDRFASLKAVDFLSRNSRYCNTQKGPKKRIDYSSQSTDLRVVLFPSLLVVVIYFVPHRTPLAPFNCAV